MTKVLGIDIGARFVVGFLLEELPVGIAYPEFYRKNSKSCISMIRMDNSDDGSSIKLDKAIELLERIKPDAIVMEPTGVWYSKLWAKLAEHLDIEVKWIGHSDLAYNRGAYGFNDKDDPTDAFCLAVSYFHPDYNNLNRWLNWRVGLICDVNDRILELESLYSTTQIFKAQLKQRLKYEFPECADRAISNSRTKDGFTAWVGWIAGMHKATRIDNGYQKSIAVSIGIEFSDYTRAHALSLASNQIRETQLKNDLTCLLLDPAFDKYRPVLEKFGFGIKMQGVILSQIYPFEKFLRDDKAYIERWEDHIKWHKRNRSLSGFQLSLGMGKRLIQSGGSTQWVYSGSGLARTKLYTWIMKYVIPARMESSWVVQELNKRSAKAGKDAMTVSKLRDKWKTSQGSNSDKHMAGAAIAMTLAYRVTRLLYEELLKEVQS